MADYAEPDIQAEEESMPYGPGYYMPCGVYVGDDELSAVAHMERCKRCDSFDPTAPQSQVVEPVDGEL